MILLHNCLSLVQELFHIPLTANIATRQPIPLFRSEPNKRIGCQFRRIDEELLDLWRQNLCNLCVNASRVVVLIQRHKMSAQVLIFSKAFVRFYTYITGKAFVAILGVAEFGEAHHCKLARLIRRAIGKPCKSPHRRHVHDGL